jgi:hypothetical protein
MTEFELTAYQNEFLPEHAGRVDAIVTVTATGSGRRTWMDNDSAVVLMLDTSGSMQPRPKWKALQRAAEVAIGRIADGVWFGVIAGSEVAEVVYPRVPGLAQASNATRAEAVSLVRKMRPRGGTAIGQWLWEARDRLAPYENAIRQAILLTDGQDVGESPDQLRAAVAACEGVFQCDCRGVGTDWQIDELRLIAASLLGSVDIVADPDDMAADFEAMMRTAMGRRVGDVALRVWTPRGARVEFVKRVAPDIDDLTDRARVIDERHLEYPTGAWGDESRDYHIAIRVPPQSVGGEMLAARVSLMVDGAVSSQALVKAIWTDDPVASTRISPRVAHYTDQAELAKAIADGLDAQRRGDDLAAERDLSRAVSLAASTGHSDTLRLLGRVVDVVDAPTGTIRLRRNVALADAMTLDTRSTRTVRVARER